MATSALALAFSISACGAGNESDGAPADTGDASLSGTLNGAGSSAQEAAVAAWTQGFQTANPDVTVNYDPAGSGAGREQFIAGGINFAGSDAALDEEEMTAAAAKCASDVIEVPTYISPIAIIFNLEGVTDLNLSSATLGDIFSGVITKWNDPKIVAENPDATLPSSDITPVHRSDDSGTTENFTDYLDQTSGGTWSKGAIQTWPFKSGEGAEGTSGVIAAVKGGKGTIGYADASQAGDLGVAKIKVGDEFIAYSPEAASKALDVSKEVDGASASTIVFEIDRKTTEAGTYPLVLVSYQMACTTYADAGVAGLVKGWLTYVTSQDGQKASAAGAGSAPLSAALSDKIAPIVEKIAAQ
ncbi:phosphate ABC transporter substrate-binding protein PstS [soil metagenome]